MYLLFIYGPMASGKYTIAKQLSEELGVALFHNHLTVDLVSALFEFGSPPFVSLREEIWLNSLRAAAQAEQSLIFTFAPESTVRPPFMEDAIATVQSANGQIYFVEVTCSEDVIEQRMSDESRAAFGKLRSVEMYRQLKREGNLDFPVSAEPLIRIPSDELTVEEAVQVIKLAVENAEKA